MIIYWLLEQLTDKMNVILREINREQVRRGIREKIAGRGGQKEVELIQIEDREYTISIQYVLDLKNQQKFEQSLIKINDLMLKYPEILRTYQIKGQLTFKLKRYAQSLECFDKLIQKYKTQIQSNSKQHNKQQDKMAMQNKKMLSLYLYNKGLCYQKMQKIDEAIKLFKESIIYNPLKIESYLTLAENYRMIGRMDKTKTIYHKLIIKNQITIKYFNKIIDNLQMEGQYSFILQLTAVFLESFPKHSKGEQFEKVQVYIMKKRAQCFKKLGKVDDALMIYQRLLQMVQSTAQKVQIYTYMGLCYIQANQIDKACSSYLHILQLDANNVQIMNNLANLQLRKGQYQKALNLLNRAIHIHQAHNNNDLFTLILLKSHRILASTKQSRHGQAKTDLQDIINLMKRQLPQNYNYKSKSEQRNFLFIRQIISKYYTIVDRFQLSAQEGIKEARWNEVSSILIHSIEQQLQQNNQQLSQAVKLQRLEERINKVYHEIIQFKKTTLQQYKQNCQNMHTKIIDIEETITKKEESQIKIQQELSDLKENYSQIYKMVESTKNETNGIKIKQFISKLKENKKDRLAAYAQQMYWIFNAYFISILLISNNLVSPQQNKLHINKVGSFFAKFKNIFEKISHIPHLELFCRSVNAIISLYLSEESSIIYHSINKIITTRFCSNQDLKNALQAAIIELLQSNYSEQIQEKTKKQRIGIQMNDRYGKACFWFNKKKNKMINAIFQVEHNLQTEEEKITKELVIQDVSAILVYMVKNREQYLTNTNLGQNMMSDAFMNTLNLNFKRKQILSLYKKQHEQYDKLQAGTGTCSSKCEIY